MPVHVLRILLLSDIHSNLEALEACLSAAPAHDLVVNLGDLVGYGANPNEVTDRSRNLGRYFVRGNHDKAATGLMPTSSFNPVAALAALWTRDELTPQNLQWLHDLPQGPLQIAEAGDVQFVHGSPLDEDEYLASLRDALEPMAISPVALTFFGHTHLQGGFVLNNDVCDAFRPQYASIGKTESWTLKMEKPSRHFINPGSVGQPRDGDWRAAFAVFDDGPNTIDFFRVPYDLKAAQEKILAANLPARLATRLATGQ